MKTPFQSPVLGMAPYDVTPPTIGAYFFKIRASVLSRHNGLGEYWGTFK